MIFTIPPSAYTNLDFAFTNADDGFAIDATEDVINRGRGQGYNLAVMQ
ncbi:hypothetical protein [Motilimonas pumila]|nr:hypothetical protein [Motilimonas pumila]